MLRGWVLRGQVLWVLRSWVLWVLWGQVLRGPGAVGAQGPQCCRCSGAWLLSRPWPGPGCRPVGAFLLALLSRGKSLLQKDVRGDPWVAQRLGTCLWPRA